MKTQNENSGLYSESAYARGIELAVMRERLTSNALNRFLDETLNRMLNICAWVEGFAFSRGIGVERWRELLVANGEELGALLTRWRLESPRYGIQHEHMILFVDFVSARLNAIDLAINQNAPEILQNLASLPGGFTEGLRDSIPKPGAKKADGTLCIATKAEYLREENPAWAWYKIAATIERELESIPQSDRTPDEDAALQTLQKAKNRVNEVKKAYHNTRRNRKFAVSNRSDTR